VFVLRGPNQSNAPLSLRPSPTRVHPPLDNVVTIAAQEVVDRLDADADRPGRLVLIQILEREVRSARLLDDAFDHAIDRRIVAALETRHLERNEIRMPRGELCRPHLMIGARRVAILPHVADIQRMRDESGAYLIAEQPF
jgi:hypothetical protein